MNTSINFYLSKKTFPLLRDTPPVEENKNPPFGGIFILRRVHICCSEVRNPTNIL